MEAAKLFQMKRIIRKRKLTKAEAASIDAVRTQVTQEFLPVVPGGIGNWNRTCLARMTKNGAKTRAASSRT